MTLTADTSNELADLATGQSVWTSFRTTLAERQELRDHAHLARISVSKLVRRRSLRQPPPKAAVPQINAKTYAALGQIGNNLNQQTKLANESRQLTPAQLPQLVKVLTELNALLNQVRREVIGADQKPEAAE